MQMIKGLLISLCFVSLAFAEHPMSKIRGKGIKLFTQGHAIAGKIGEKLVFGNVAGDHHSQADLTVHKDGKIFKASFNNSMGFWGGHMLSDGETKTIKLIEFDKKNSIYTVSFFGTEYKVKVESKEFKDNHFINPKYVLYKGEKQIKAKMLKGQACRKYSMQLIFMIFGAYLI
jgi:hypothetical protein